MIPTQTTSASKIGHELSDFPLQRRPSVSESTQSLWRSIGRSGKSRRDRLQSCIPIAAGTRLDVDRRRLLAHVHRALKPQALLQGTRAALPAKRNARS